MAALARSMQVEDAAHLLRRAGFGGTPDQIAHFVSIGSAAATNEVLNYENTPFDFDDDALLERLLITMPERIRGGNLQIPVQAIRLWWTYRLLTTPRPLEEKMVLFWHNHFTSKDDDGLLMLRQNQLYRTHALGNFRTLALAVSRDPEMLRYLNGNQNYRAHPNENYARELMELFTCGRVDPSGKPNYTEDDIKASARAFSGWNLRDEKFYFNPNQHDDTTKTFMGRTGNFNGDDIVDILVSLPATAAYVCTKLFRYFAYEDPDQYVVRELVRVYYASGYSIREVVSTIFRSDAFWSPKAQFALFKSPADYVVGAVRVAGLTDLFAPPLEQIVDDEDPAARGRRGPSPLARLNALTNAMRSMGQQLFAPETVKGWDGGRKWISTDTLQARARFANTISQLPAVIDTLAGALPYAPGAQAQSRTAAFAPASGDPAALVDTILRRMGPLTVSRQSYDALVAYARTETDPRPRLSGVFSLVLGTPEYQMA
ncbi:MAG: DUF1800 domain-containing protein [Capsulimonadaceae bacterium]|nr:DUF1800 domain-containing protein [Capsulimonadaceae bacterium]